MRKIKILFIIGMVVLFAACTYPTVIRKTVSETTGPGGRKTVTITKSIEQSAQIGLTKSTNEVIQEFNQ